MNFNSKQNMQNITSVFFNTCSALFSVVNFIHLIILSYQRLFTCADDMALIMFFTFFFGLNDRPIIVICLFYYYYL